MPAKRIILLVVALILFVHGCLVFGQLPHCTPGPFMMWLFWGLGVPLTLVIVAFLLSVRKRDGVPEPATREQARACLLALGATQVFVDAYDGKDVPHGLQEYFRPAERFYTFPVTQQHYLGGRCVPLLDDGQFLIVTFYATESGHLVNIPVEYPSEILWTFKNWQQYLGWLFLSMARGGFGDSRLMEIASVIGFEHAEAALAFLGEAKGARDRNSREKAFIARLA